MEEIEKAMELWNEVVSLINTEKDTARELFLSKPEKSSRIKKIKKAIGKIQLELDILDSVVDVGFEYVDNSKR